MKDALRNRLDGKESLVGIVGMGYVGLPLMLRFSEVGYRVLGIDVDQSKVDMLNEGESYIGHISSDLIAGARKKGFEATADFSRAAEPDALIICVPTPLSKHMDPDMTYVEGTINSLAPHLRRGQVVSLESTTYPGTTDEILRPRIEERGFTIGRDVFLVYSPEREDPGNPVFQTRTIPKVCGGSTPECLEIGMSLYGQVIDQVVPVSSTRVAEMTKLLENIHRAVNIGLVNEMKMICDRMGMDIHEVIRASSTKPFGFVPYYPGPGLGGHCIPIDPFYLTWKAREYGIHSRFIELAGEINSSMPQYVVDRIVDGLNNAGRSVRGSRILVLGVAYKKNVDDMRESPSVEIMEMLVSKGAHVDYSDPHVPRFPSLRSHHFKLESVSISEETLAQYDCVVLATNHDSFDYEMIGKHSKLLVDTRGTYSVQQENIVKA